MRDRDRQRKTEAGRQTDRDTQTDRTGERQTERQRASGGGGGGRELHSKIGVTEELHRRRDNIQTSRCSPSLTLRKECVADNEDD